MSVVFSLLLIFNDMYIDFNYNQGLLDLCSFFLAPWEDEAGYGNTHGLIIFEG